MDLSSSDIFTLGLNTVVGCQGLSAHSARSPVLSFRINWVTLLCMLLPGRVIPTLWKCCWKRVSGKTLKESCRGLFCINVLHMLLARLLQTQEWTSGTMRTSWLWTWPPTRGVPRFSKGRRKAVSTADTRGQDCIAYAKMMLLRLWVSWEENNDSNLVRSVFSFVTVKSPSHHM